MHGGPSLHSPFVVSDGFDGGASPWSIRRAVTAHRVEAGMPPGFRLHDLRHYFASALIASGADIQLVSSMVRHADATMTLRVYSHLFPSDDARARAKAAEVFGVRPAEPPRALSPSRT
ncbi:tyrosine-type recombinase/integrase [Monashia sp. NPDC004114]